MYALRLPLWGAALGLLLSACEYEVTPDVPDASGPFVGNVSLIWAPTSYAVTATSRPSSSRPPSCSSFRIRAVWVPWRLLRLQATPDRPPEGGVEPLTVSAGTIAIADTARRLPVARRCSFSGLGYYPISSAETPTLLWNPGDTLSVGPRRPCQPLLRSIVAPPAFTE